MNKEFLNEIKLQVYIGFINHLRPKINCKLIIISVFRPSSLYIDPNELDVPLPHPLTPLLKVQK